jgi:hypothetical protein
MLVIVGALAAVRTPAQKNTSVENGLVEEPHA